MVNLEIALKMYDEGKTLKQIGDYFDVSRQRIWQVLKNNYSLINNHHQKRAYKKIHNNTSELYIIGLLTKLGFSVKAQPYNHYFDLIVNNKKIEIKHCLSPKKTKFGDYYSFQELTPISPIDFFIFVCGSLRNSRIFIVPAKKVKSQFYIAVSPKYLTTKRLYKKYLDNWDLLDTIPIDK